jgi:hypothetical protein
MSNAPKINDYSVTLGQCEWRKWMEAPLEIERAYRHYLVWLRKGKKYRMLRCFECLVPLVYITLKRKRNFPLRDNENDGLLVSMATELFMALRKRTFRPETKSHFVNWSNKVTYHFMRKGHIALKLERDLFHDLEESLPWIDDELVNPIAASLSVDRRIFLTEELPVLVTERILKLRRYGMDHEAAIRYIIPRVWDKKEVSYGLVASRFSLPKSLAKDYISWVLVSMRRVLYDVRDDYSSLMYVEDTPYERIPDVFTA